MIFDHGNKKHFYHKYLSQTVFFLCTGPSLNNYDLTKLNNKITYSIKTIPLTHYKTTMWCGMEKHNEISAEILEDPTIIKFVSDNVYNANYVTNGKLKTFYNLQNIFWFSLSIHYQANTFFSSPDVSWGLPKNARDEDRIPGRRSIMLASFKLFYYLGFKRIVLLGCDFNMTPEQAYCYGRKKGIIACQENNVLYETLQKRFTRLKPYIAQAGIEVFNCNPNSRLTVFPYKSYESCLEYL